VARGYRAVTPALVRRGISNFLDNLAYPRTIINEFLQGKFADSGRDTVRLVVNTVFGLGLFDPASRAGLEQHDEDFGLTLAKWGVPMGPFVELPVLGPSSVRDGIGKIPDAYTEGQQYVTDPYVSYGLWALNLLDIRTALLDTDNIVDSAYDPYALVRNAWLQRRNYLVHGDVPVTDDTSLDPEQPNKAP
jgi:phospholipid-binding lipoprotein MlaA